MCARRAVINNVVRVDVGCAGVSNGAAVTNESNGAGAWKGGTEKKHRRERHSNTTVTVEVVNEGQAAVYGQYLTEESLSGSLRCDLGLASYHEDGFTGHAPTRAVVDSGASWTAIRLDTLLATLSNERTSAPSFI